MIGVKFDENLFTLHRSDKIIQTIATFDINGFWEFVKERHCEYLFLNDIDRLKTIICQTQSKMPAEHEIKSILQIPDYESKLEPQIANTLKRVSNNNKYLYATDMLLYVFFSSPSVNGIWFAYLYYFVFVVMQFHAWGEGVRESLRGYEIFLEYVKQHPEYEISQAKSDSNNDLYSAIQGYIADLITIKTTCNLLQKYLDEKIKKIEPIQDESTFLIQQELVDNHVEDTLDFLNNVFTKAAPLRENLRNMTVVPLIYNAVQQIEQQFT